MTRRPEQSGFVAGRSTVDATLALRLLSDLHQEFDRLLNVAFLDIKAAFNSVDRRALWKGSTEVPDILLDLIDALHENTGVSVSLVQNLSDRLQTTFGVRHGYVLAPALFNIAIDWILRHMSVKPEIAVSHDHFSDLVYADDTALFVNSASEAVACLDSFKETAAEHGLRVSWPKTKLQNLGAGTQLPAIAVDGNTVDSVDSFIYLVSVFPSNSYCRPDINRYHWPGVVSDVITSPHLEAPSPFSHNQNLNLSDSSAIHIVICS